MPPDDEERRRGTEEIMVALRVNMELTRDLRRRVDRLSSNQLEEIAELQAQVGTIVRDDALHDTHHEWVKAQLALARDRAAFWKDLRDKLAVAGALGAAGILGTVLWYSVRQFIKSGGVVS